MEINPPTNMKYIQFLGSPFRGKRAEQLKKQNQNIKESEVVFIPTHRPGMEKQWGEKYKEELDIFITVTDEVKK
jgi:hypothetical protein